jgi:hypothetical protein
VVLPKTIHSGIVAVTTPYRIPPDTGVCIHHLSHKSVAQWIEKTNRYTSIPDRLHVNHAGYDLAAFAHANIDSWIAQTVASDRGDYPTAVAILRSVYDIIDRLKIWEAEEGLGGNESFSKICKKLEAEYAANSILRKPIGGTSRLEQYDSVSYQAGMEEASRLQQLFAYATGPLRDGLRHVRAISELAQQRANDTIEREQKANSKLVLELADCERRLNGLKQALTEHGDQIFILHQIAAERDSEIVRLNQSLAERDRRVVTVTQAVDRHINQIACLNRTVAARDEQNADLSRQIAESNQQLAALHESTSWQMTWPVRAVTKHVPRPLRRVGRRTLKAAWWAVTPLRLPARFRTRRAAQALLNVACNEGTPGVDGQTVEAAEAMTADLQREEKPVGTDRFSLSQLPRLDGGHTAATAWYDSVDPDVSIIILNWNRSDMTLLCLHYLWQHTSGHSYEVIVVDNGSRPDELKLLHDNAVLPRIIELRTNRYFGEANNLGVEAARGRYICLLNNDAFVHDAWLAPLGSFMEANPQAGAVGPRFLYPDGRLQEAGALVDAEGSVIQIGKGEAAEDPKFGSVRKVDYVSAACVLMRRKEFLRPYVATTTSVDTADRFGDVLVMFLSSSRFP